MLNDIMLVSDGRSGADFARRLKETERPCALSIHFLEHGEFKATSGVKYEVKILKVSDFPQEEQNLWGVIGKALWKGWDLCPREVAALLEEKVSDEDIKSAGLIGIHVILEEPYFDCPFGKDEPDASWDLKINPDGEYRLSHAYARFGTHKSRSLHPDMGVAFIAHQK